MASSSTKRRRADPSGIGSPGRDDVVADLPDETLAQVCDYLPKISAGLFAVALTAPSSSWRKDQWRQQLSPASKAVMSSFASRPSTATQWEILDFAEVDEDPNLESVLWLKDIRGADYGRDFEESYCRRHLRVTLANKLTDDDIGALLVCIDAVHNTKRLKLTGCINITGSGLAPLRGSTFLQQIDLSLVKEKMLPKIEPIPFISFAKVGPILRSIVQTEGNTLKQIQLPHKWYSDEVKASFFVEYSQLLDSRPFNCSGCGEGNCQGRETFPWLWNLSDSSFQGFTCYLCLENICLRPRGNNGCFNCLSCDKFTCTRCNPYRRCATCKRYHCKGCTTAIRCRCDFQRYCRRCAPETTCEMCHWEETDACPRCTAMKACSFCSRTVCGNCIIPCDFCTNSWCGGDDCDKVLLQCGTCERVNCAKCVEEEGAVRQCETCEMQFCKDCRMERRDDTIDNGESLCEGCTESPPE